MRYFLLFIGILARALLSLRYKVEIRGFKELLKKAKGQKGILLVPNHTAHIDPMILLAWFWPFFEMRPMIVEYISQIPLLRVSIPFIRGVLMPNFESSMNQYKLKKGEKVIQTVVDGLDHGDNFAIFPSGRFKSEGREHLSGASGVHTLIQKRPETPVLLIRFSGLWGSSFSKALTGKTPSIAHQIKEGIKILFKNLFFFTPRRKIYIDWEFNPEGLPKKGSRIEFNRFLENWYNHYLDDENRTHESEPLKLVRNYFWSKKLPQVRFLTSKNKTVEPLSSSEEIKAKLYSQIRKILDQPQLKITPEMYLGRDLGMDSLNVAEMIAYLSKNYNIQNIGFEDLQKVEDLIAAARGSLKSEEENPQKESHTWPEEKGRRAPQCLEGATFPEAFLRVCEKMGSFAAMGDDVSGVLSYRTCKKAVLVLAEAFRRIPEDRVALLLPSSVGSTLVLLALLFAGKTPVPLNWTLGPRVLEQMMALSGAKRVISSWLFLEKLNFVDFGSLSDQIELLEETRRSLTWKNKLKGVLLSLRSTSSILKILKSLDENSTAVILFTSGSESGPKGVPLSHKNILSTIRNCYRNLEGAYTPEDVMYGVLPQFHSFGFSNSTFTPLLCGMRVAFYPNPTDPLGLAEGIARWKVTFVPIVPTFLKKLLEAAKPEQLKTVRFFITAGEKTPEKLFQQVRSLNQTATLLEGYGLSETSPVLAMAQVGKEGKGVGQLFSDVEAISIHPETLQLNPEGTPGEICVRGPNVFHGYLGNTPSPFINIKGQLWFRTGDLGFIQPDRTLILTGRLKRFIKIGGEMISLGAIEEALADECAKRKLAQEGAPSLAICPQEGDEPKLILFTTFPFDLTLAHEWLHTFGFSRLIKIGEIRQVDEIPLMGTGKVNYRKLLDSL